MSSTVATRTTIATGSAARPAAAGARKPASGRSVGRRDQAVIGRPDRPVLRIVAGDTSRPMVTRLAPAAPPAERVEPTESTPLRRVGLEEFFAVDGQTQELRMAPRRSVRLTRRGRVWVLGVSLVATLGLGLLAASGSAATDHPERTRVIVVGTGDTLWDIASRTAPDGDVRGAVSHLEQLNHLDSSSVQAGQHLRVPTT